MKKLATLYKKTATGAVQTWTIGTEKNVIVTRWGQKGGALQETRDVIASGKNIGRSNETTPIQQAELEAKAQWEKKLKKGYVKTEADAAAGQTDDIIEGGVSPMLAHGYSKHGHKIVWPAFTQPKLDGHRCIGVLENGVASLWSRSRKRITGLPHIEAELLKMRPALGFGRIVVDGELYNHAYKNKFEELSSFIRSEDPKPGHEVVQYHLYDYVECDLWSGLDTPFQERTLQLNADIQYRTDNNDTLHYVQTDVVKDEDELMASFQDFLQQGYEGAIVRNAAGLYVNRRSYDLLKVKEFDDAEFRVVDVVEGRGKLAGHGMFICETKPGGPTFECKLMGELSSLKQYWEDPSLAIGRKLTVKFQGFTNANNVPRFPVAVRFREDL